jgi:hypothetical protein
VFDFAPISASCNVSIHVVKLIVRATYSYFCKVTFPLGNREMLGLREEDSLRQSA